jgi:hypothetical protein
MKTTEQKFLDEQPEGRLFAVIIGFIMVFGLFALSLGVVWCVACGVTKLIEIIK